ncbi:vitellogenin-like [Brachionichthys hirsutus]|uniref:vitellogenin-like n=1 Tax=Brachionichthys hirsutus TaxID=412623 RepID=UPI0036051CFE
MWKILLCCLAALATCESVHYELNLNPNKTYEYKYSGDVNFGLGLPNLAESAVRISCNFKISGVSAETFLLQVSDFAFEELNGFPGKSSFHASPKLSQNIAAHLIKPFMFSYAHGHVGNISASAEIPESVVNIIRGILGLFQVTLKTGNVFYELEEVNIHGKCQTNYATEMNEEKRNMTITQIVDVTACRVKAELYRGMATAVLDKVSKQRGESVSAIMKYVHIVKPTEEGGVITRAHGLERRHFSAFNVKDGTFKMQAIKEMVLLNVGDTATVVEFGPVESKGSLVYIFGNASIPITMQNLDNPRQKATELIKHLAKTNKYEINSSTTEDTIKLYQLLRVVPCEELEYMWRDLADNPEHRRWFLDMIVEVSDARILTFLETRFQARDLSISEALQTFLMSINHLQAIPELVEKAQNFLNMPFSKSNTHLHQTVVLSYGSLVYKYCAYNTPCPVTAVQPLLDMAIESLRNNNEKDMILALKALGNAGHPRSIKTIMRFLPGVSANPVELPYRVLSAALQSLRLIASRDPHSVQDLTMNVFLQKSLDSEIRMLAFMILLNTKPSFGLVSTLTAHLVEEKDLQVASFAFSYLRSFARSRTPEHFFLSTACNVAMKLLAPKLGRLSNYKSKAIRMDWFKDDFLMGAAAESFMLKRKVNLLPTEIMMKGKLFLIGRILQLLEIGINADGINDLIGNRIFSYEDFQAFFSLIEKNGRLPDSKTLLSVFTRASGQEWFYIDINMELIQNLIRVFRPSAGKESPLWDVIERLHQGQSWHWTKAFLIMEARYLQSTSLGLPMEISKYYHVLNGVTVKAKATVNPPMNKNIGELLASEISMETDGFFGYTKDFWLFYGINTELFQCGSEFKGKLSIAVPWNFHAKLNVKAKEFELDAHPCKKEIKLLSVSSDVYAITRNSIDTDATKITPMLPNTMDADDQYQKQKMWHPKFKTCAKSKTYGAGLCLEFELRRQYYQEEYPLYYFLGYTRVALTIVPVDAVKAVDKIHFKVHAYPSSLPTASHQQLETLKSLSKEDTQQESLSCSASVGESLDSNQDFVLEELDSKCEPVLTIKVLAMSGNRMPEGYHAVFYRTADANVRKHKMIVSQVGKDANWKMCINTLKKMHSDVTTHISWGAECQSSEVSIKCSGLHGSKSTYKSKVHWRKIPKTMAAMGRSIETYIPGMAFLLGFTQQCQINAKQEVSTTITSSADGIGVMIHFPEYTIYSQYVPVPLAPDMVLQQAISNTTIYSSGDM